MTLSIKIRFMMNTESSQVIKKSTEDEKYVIKPYEKSIKSETNPKMRFLMSYYGY